MSGSPSLLELYTPTLSGLCSCCLCAHRFQIIISSPDISAEVHLYTWLVFHTQHIPNWIPLCVTKPTSSCTCVSSVIAHHQPTCSKQDTFEPHLVLFFPWPQQFPGQSHPALVVLHSIKVLQLLNSHLHPGDLPYVTLYLIPPLGQPVDQSYLVYSHSLLLPYSYSFSSWYQPPMSLVKRNHTWHLLSLLLTFTASA